MKSAIVIPARLESTRLPRKLLLRETGQSLIEHTYRAASCSQLASLVIVATDHQQIADEVTGFGGYSKLTRPDHTSGTDRVAEVAAELADCEIVVNLQGDEPEIPSTAINLAISMLAENERASIVTLATPIRDRKSLLDPACVKIVFDQWGRAMYFSRSWIPYARNWDDKLLETDKAIFYQHIGLYAYRRQTLLELARLKPVPLELIESLEQLRFLYCGFRIHVGVVDHPVRGIDTREDYVAFVSRLKSG